LPNKIFDKGFTPNEFVVYSFLTKAKNKSGQSYWSVPNIAHYFDICIPLAEKHCHHLKKKATLKFLNDTVIIFSKVTSIRSTEF